MSNQHSIVKLKSCILTIIRSSYSLSITLFVINEKLAQKSTQQASGVARGPQTLRPLFWIARVHVHVYYLVYTQHGPEKSTYAFFCFLSTSPDLAADFAFSSRYNVSKFSILTWDRVEAAKVEHFLKNRIFALKWSWITDMQWDWWLKFGDNFSFSLRETVWVLTGMSRKGSHRYSIKKMYPHCKYMHMYVHFSPLFPGLVLLKWIVIFL